MKKILLSLMLVSLSVGAFAMTNVNFNTANYTCNGTQVNPQSTIDQLMANCKNSKLIHRVDNTAGRSYRGPGAGVQNSMPNSTEADDENLDKVKFYTDDGSYMICYYNNQKFVKCKVQAPKTPKASKALKLPSSTIAASSVSNTAVSK